MQKHQNKSKSSQLNSIGKERQKEGRIQTNSGHVFVPHEADRNSEFNEQYFEDEAPKSKSVKIKKKTSKEYLKQQIKVKTENRTKKTNLQSFKSKYLTLKKKTAQLQAEHGVEADFMIIMRNNLQSSNVTNCSKTAGKYMISAVGPLKERLKKEKW